MLLRASNYYNMSPYARLGRGIEYANARSKHIFRNRCTHSIQEMEFEIRYSFSLAVQPDSLTCKYERRVRDHMRSYRIGVLSAAPTSRRCLKSSKHTVICWIATSPLYCQILQMMKLIPTSTGIQRKSSLLLQN